MGNALKAAALLVSAVLVAPCRAALDSAAFDAEQRRILEQIEQIQSRDGPYSPALLEGLKQLIVLYRENDSPSLALVTIERALQVVRANSGLYSLEQVPLLWQRIESEEELDDDAQAWDAEQELLALVRRYPDDARVAPVLRRVADRRMGVLGRVLAAGEIPPQVFLGCYYDKYRPSDTACSGSGSRTTVVQGMLADAGRNYADAIAALLRNGAYGSDELRELEMELVRGAELMRDMPLAPRWIFASTLEPWRSRIAPIEELATWQLPSEPAGTPERDYLDQPEPREDRFRMPYYRGRQSLRRLYSYELTGSSAAASRAAAMVAIADWDLLFSNNALALEGYALAQGLLGEGADDASLAALFAPEVPVVLPSFEPNPLVPDGAHAATGHIDVTFSITKYGRARDIKVRGAANADSADRAELMNLLRVSRFRPRSIDGRFTDSPVAVRYYVYGRGRGAT